ncbi:hypothetical protein R1CP_37155 (plasmid) [Rhodococcus opacus]|uniref:Uncharacterized protein n=1 Tax=Rhodococcus opacus TaxID=37919 RepID=A0A1B1KHF5_RHOOP|nr:hypothetical protein R1CP_37155 [Rhodococcus opacus]
MTTTADRTRPAPDIPSPGATTLVLVIDATDPAPVRTLLADCSASSLHQLNVPKGSTSALRHNSSRTTYRGGRGSSASTQTQFALTASPDQISIPPERAAPAATSCADSVGVAGSERHRTGRGCAVPLVCMGMMCAAAHAVLRRLTNVYQRAHFGSGDGVRPASSALRFTPGRAQDTSRRCARPDRGARFLPPETPGPGHVSPPCVHMQYQPTKEGLRCR